MDAAQLISGTSLLYVLIQSLKMPSAKFAYKSMVFNCLCVLSSASDFITELRVTDSNAIPFVVNEMQRKSFRQRRMENENVDGFMALMNMLKRDMAVMRMQSLFRGAVARKHRIAQLLLEKRHKKFEGLVTQVLHKSNA